MYYDVGRPPQTNFLGDLFVFVVFIAAFKRVQLYYGALGMLPVLQVHSSFSRNAPTILSANEGTPLLPYVVQYLV